MEATGSEVLFRDSTDIQPPSQMYEKWKDTDNFYENVPASHFVACPEDIWQPVHHGEDEWGEQEVKGNTRLQEFLEDLSRRLVDILDHKFCVFCVTMMTVWALFMDDLIVGVPMSREVDYACAWTTLIFLLLFLIEQALRSWAQREEYFLSFFWWMELLANFSMILSLGPIIQPGAYGYGRREGPWACDGVFDVAQLGGGQWAAGTRLARVMRLLRVIRVIRVFASCSKTSNRNSTLRKNQQSKIGKRINEMLVRSLILVVIALSLIFPMLSFDEIDNSRALAFSMLVKGRNYSTYPEMLSEYKYQGEHNADGPTTFIRGYMTLLKTVVHGEATLFAVDTPTDGGVPITGAVANACMSNKLDTFAGCPPNFGTSNGMSPPHGRGMDGIRCLAILSIPAGAQPGDPNVAYWDISHLNQYDALYSIFYTILLIVVIITMYILLSMDVTVMVVQPIESMVSLVQRLSENPTLQLEVQSKSKYETESVRIALAKIVGLMQLGFGGAGHEIISANLANSGNTGLDLMLRGKKKECAYGFCDIRQFTDTVECLQDQVMLFTNSVGEIVHQSCHDNRGEPNKNIGDAFLIVWRSRTLNDHTKIVDGALTSFRRCVREIASSQTLQLVTDVKAIHKKFGDGKYRTKLGFGLHFGWSVEGPVGSPTKIDCSYLSPEVKISDRLEAATKIYSSNILMSGQFYDLLSDHMKVGIRLIDHVTLKNQFKPYRIYADDRSNLSLRMSPRLIDIYGAEAAYEQFSKHFHEGIDAFIKGDWPTAQQKLDSAHDFCPKDVPTTMLIKEMKKRSIDKSTPTAPVDWKGYHESDI